MGIALIGGLAFVYANRVTIIVNSAETRCCIDKRLVADALAVATNRMNIGTHKREKIEACNSFKRARARYDILLLIMSKYRGPRVRIVRRFGALAGFTPKLAKSTTRISSGTNLTLFSYRLLE